MADPLDYQVPLLPGLCTSQTTFDSYIQSLNLAMDMTVQVINEELGLELKLPGIPPIPLPKSPDIRLPEMLPWERRLRLQGTPVPTGYVGNVYPLRNQKKFVQGKLTFPGIPEAVIGAPEPGVVPGVDPSTYVINLLNQNLQIMFQFLIEQGVEVEQIVIPTVELCGEDGSGEWPGGTPGASPGQIIVNQILQQNLNNALTNLGVACVFGAFQPFTNYQDPGPVNDGGTAWNANGGGGVFNPLADNSFAMTTSTTNQLDVDNFETVEHIGGFYDPNRQPTVCGHGFTLQYTIIPGGALALNLESYVDLYKLSPGNIRTHVDGNLHLGGGPQIDSFVIAAGVYGPTDTIGLDIYVSASPAPLGVTVHWTHTLTDNGP